MENEIILQKDGAYGIRTVVGLAEKPAIPVKITGLIGCALAFLTKRLLDGLQNHILVNKDEGSITLIVNEHNQYGDTAEIIGEIRKSKELKVWNINKDTEYNTFELADLIKMNRHHFASQVEAMKLVTELKAFKAKVDKEIELQNNNRGNNKAMVDQVVKSNIPEKFNLRIPIFSGEKPVDIEVEIYINHNSLRCSLVSVQLEELIQSETARILNDQIEQIKSVNPAIPIFEI